MIIVEVTFKIDSSLTEEILREKFLETASIYKTTTGLIRKNYISDLKNNIAGGIYCFDNMLNAKRWFDDERIEWITNRYSKPEIKFYENYVVVDNESKKIISDDNL